MQPVDTDFTDDLLRAAKITPWSLLREEDFLLEATKLGDIEERSILDRLQKHGVVLLRMGALTPTADLLQSLENHLGDACEVQNDHVGKIKGITPEEGKEAISGDSAAELAAHVDGTQDDPLPPAMLAFQYLSGATHGGHSTFFDMADVLRSFAPSQRAQILADLARSDAAICEKSKKQKDGTIWTGRYEGALVKLVCDDAACSVRVRFDRVMKIAPPYQASFEALQAAVLARKEAQRITFLPREGDVAIFDNWRVMHGRLAVSGRHERTHHRIWIRKLAARHSGRVLLGVRGFGLEQLAAIKRTAALAPGT